MNNKTQLERYKKLISYIENNLKEDINIETIESICHYSYRNINRIFEALHQETIGKYIKRLRLEKASQYLKYSDMGISDIAYEVGFEDRVVFSKAFKKKYCYSPSAFRNSNQAILKVMQQTLIDKKGADRQPLQFEIEYLPSFNYLFIEHRGAYNNISAIEDTGNYLYNYALSKGIINNRSIFMTEIMDDSDISDSIHLRYNLGFILEKPLSFEPENLFRTKSHRRQKYAKFTHIGSHQNCIDFYNEIYAFWLLDVALELKDLPTLEFYPNYATDNDNNNILTQIYIPIE